MEKFDLNKKIIKEEKKDIEMNKKLLLAIGLLLTFGSLSVFSAGVEELPALNSSGDKEASSAKSTTIDINSQRAYYPNATTKSIAAKYKMGNYSGCLQEIYSLLKKEPSNAIAYYYLALVNTHLNNKAEAVAAYEKVIALHPSQYLVDFATKGRDCLTDGPACHPEAQQAKKQEEQLDDLDKFIRAPYGNGLSPELNNEIRQQQLTNIKETINKKDNLENRDIQKIKKFDNNKSEAEETIKIAQVSDEEVLKAVNTLKEAGLNVSVQSSESNPYAQMSQYQDPRMTEMSMLLGGNNNNNNNMMNTVLPMLMTQAQKGENVDPRLMQAVMMNSMMSDFSFANSNNNNN